MLFVPTQAVFFFLFFSTEAKRAGLVLKLRTRAHTPSLCRKRLLLLRQELGVLDDLQHAVDRLPPCLQPAAQLLPLGRAKVAVARAPEGDMQEGRGRGQGGRGTKGEMVRKPQRRNGGLIPPCPVFPSSFPYETKAVCLSWSMRTSMRRYRTPASNRPPTHQGT